MTAYEVVGRVNHWNRYTLIINDNLNKNCILIKDQTRYHDTLLLVLAYSSSVLGAHGAGSCGGGDTRATTYHGSIWHATVTSSLLMYQSCNSSPAGSHRWSSRMHVRCEKWYLEVVSNSQIWTLPCLTAQLNRCGYYDQNYSAISHCGRTVGHGWSCLSDQHRATNIP